MAERFKPSDGFGPLIEAGLIEQISDIVFATDVEGRLTFIGPQVERYGYKVEEVIGRHATELIIEEDRDRIAEDIRSTLTADENLGPSTFRVAAADTGDIYVFEENVKVQHNQSGDIIGMAGVIRDITERRNLELKQRESESRYRTLFESAGDGILLLEDDKFIDCNGRALELYGCTREELLGRTPYELSPQKQPDGRASKESGAEKLAAALSGIPQTFKWLHVRDDGSEFLAEVSLNRLSIDGRPYLQEIVRDVTERHRTLKALSESEERFRVLVENVPSVCWCCDAHGQMRYISPNIEQVLGFLPMEIYVGGADFWYGRVHDEDRRRVAASFAELMRSGAKFDIEYRVQHRDGEWIWIHDQADTVAEMEGKQAIGVFSDITDRKMAEERALLQKEQLLRADKLASLGTLVAGVAHEVNNPANFITLNAPLIQETWCSVVPILDDYARENGDFVIGGIDYSEMRELMPDLLSGVIEGGDRIRDIVASLKRYAATEPPKPKSGINLNNVVASALKLINPQVRKVTNRFSVEYTEELPPVTGVEQQLEQVVINLVMNACQSLQSTEDAIILRTSCGDSGQGVYLLVEDEGCGMSAETLQHIAEPFYSTRWDSDGAGLGLSISSSIVKDHGGDLSYESELGRGTRVRLRLPSVTTQPGNIGDIKDNAW